MKLRQPCALSAMGSLSAAVALLSGLGNAHAQGAPGAGSFPGSFLVPGTQTSFKVGGYVKLDYTYDFGAQEGINGGAGPIGIPLDSGPPHRIGNGLLITMPADDAHHIHGTSQMTASESRFNIETRTPTSFGELKTFIEGDFTNPDGLSNSSSLHVNSNSYGFRLREAYGTLGPFLAGQTASLFRDSDAEAETLDFGGPMATGVTRQPQVRYTFDFGDGLTWAVAAENPQTQIFDVDDSAPVGSQFSTTFGSKQGDKIPDFTTAVVYTAPWGHLNLHAVFRDLYWHNGGLATPLVEGSSTSTFGWGIGFSGAWTLPIFTGKDGLGWEAAYGQGAGRYINSDGAPTPDAFLASSFDNGSGIGTRTRVLKAVPSWLVNANYVHFWTDTLRSNIAGSYWHQDNGKAVGANQSASNDNASFLWKSAYTVNANLIWSPVEQTNFGVEFIRMQGKLESGQKGELTRIQVSAQFKF